MDDKLAQTYRISFPYSTSLLKCYRHPLMTHVFLWIKFHLRSIGKPLLHMSNH